MPASAASGADSAAQIRRFRPCRRAPSATAIVPATGRTRPSSDELADAAILEQPLGRELVRAGQKCERNRKVEARAFLAQRRRSEVDRDPVPAGPRSCALTMPLWTRCFASWQARSASPTIENEGSRKLRDPPRPRHGAARGRRRREVRARASTPPTLRAMLPEVKRTCVGSNERRHPLSDRRRPGSTRSTRRPAGRYAG